MVARLALVCIVECILVILLAWQVFAGEDPHGVGTRHADPTPAQPASGAARPEQAAARPAQPSPPAVDAAKRQEVVAEWSADDPVGVLLTGSLRLRDGRPVDAVITATLGKQREYTGSEGGSYALPRLRPGTWQVTLHDDAIIPTEHALVITAAAVQQHDFVLAPSLPVRVMIVTAAGEDGTRARRTTLSGWSDFTVVGQAGPFPERLAPTDYRAVRAGDARWDREMNPRDGFAGTLYLTSVPAHVALLQRHLVLAQQVIDPGQTEAKFVVDVEALRKLAGTATVRVLDAESGAPLPDARVSFSTSNRGGGGAKVDAQGRAVVRGLSPGFLQCGISAKDHESYFHTVRVEPGQRLELGDVRLGPNLPLTGTVLGPDDKPAGAWLAWTELKWRSTPAVFSHNRTARTEADGSFSLWGTGRGPIAVRASGADGMVAVGVFDNPPATPVVLRLVRPGTCVVTRPPDLTRTFTLTLFDAQKRPVAAYALEPRHTRLPVSLPAGDYTFEVHDERDRLVQTGTRRFGITPPGGTPGKLEIR